MRLESVFGPDALHARVADAPLFCHGAHAPVRGVDGTLFHGLLDDLEFDRCADWFPAGRFGATFHESFDSGFGEILLPAAAAVAVEPSARAQIATRHFPAA